MPDAPRELLVTVDADVDAERVAQAGLTARVAPLPAGGDVQEFLYVLSHDMGGPIRRVVSFGELLRQRLDGQLDERTASCLGYMIQGGQTLRNMLDALLQLSQVETQGRPFQSTQLTDVFTSAARRLEPALAHASAQLVVDGLPAVQGDRVQLEELAHALLDNAIKFREPGRPLSIHVGGERFAADGGERVRVRIQDNGLGFDSARIGRFFRIFGTGHTAGAHPGVGAGLAVAQRIVRRHGGTLTGTGEPGVGATLELVLPGAGGARPSAP